MMNDEGYSDGPDDVIAQLLDEIPLLYKARAFAESLKEPAFFSRLGEPLDQRDVQLARAYLEGLGMMDAAPAPLGDWSDAVSAAEALDLDPIGWEAEEMLRAGLVEETLLRLDRQALDAATHLIAAAIGEHARESAEAAAFMDDISDESIVNLSAGGLVQAANGALLVVLSEQDSEDPPHPFLARWRLYVRGRWPVGLAGSTLNIL